MSSQEEENNDRKMKKRYYIGSAIIISFFFLLLIIITALSINSKCFYNEYVLYVLYVFIFIGLLIFIFGTIQIDYYFKKREHIEGNNNHRKILRHTFVGYIFLLLAYIFLLLAYILVYKDEYKYIFIGFIGFFVLCSLISMALLSSGIDKAKDIDKNIDKNINKNHILAIFVPICVGINGIIGIVPLLIKSSSSSSIKSKSSKGDAFRSATNPLQQYLEK
jgi:MFS family permease